MLRKLYDWVFSLARSKHATKALAAVSFAESSVFPIPPDVMLAPMVLTRPDRAYFYATICTVASVLGGILGYAIGYFLTGVGEAILSFIGSADAQEHFQHWYDRFGLWVILIKGLTPFPYKLVTIASGLAQFSFPIFLIASVITRGGRFFAVAYVIKRWGPAVWERVEKRLALWTMIGLAVLIGAIVLLKVVLH
jgi:membrane protein YqaA with SNARE-associated domain